MIMIDLENNKIAVTDNGIGFEEQQYIKFLAPNFSFKMEIPEAIKELALRIWHMALIIYRFQQNHLNLVQEERC